MNKKILFSLFLISPLAISCSKSTPASTASKYNYRDVYTHNTYYRRSTAPNTGDVNLLVIPVWFSDSDNYIALDKKDSVRDDIEKAYFGSDEEVGWKSVSSFYEEDSFHNVHLKGVVTPWYEITNPSTDYYSSENNNTLRLIKKGVEWYRSIAEDSSLKDFDADHDGYLDGVAMIYACADYANIDTGGQNNLWAYCSWNFGALPARNKPSLMNYFWASYDFLYGDNALERTGFNYHNGDTRYLNIDTHCYIHEMGHNFGLPDYYDYAGSMSYSGGFSMQDYNVGGHDPHSAFSLGWVKPIVPTGNKEIKLRSYVDTGDFILLSPKYSRSAFDEYILIELFTPTGLNEFDCTYQYKGRYPSGTNEPVIRIWHVDSRLYDYDKNKLKTVPEGKMIFEATSNNSSDDQWYPNYKKLSLIRNNNESATYNEMYEAVNTDYFRTGDTFSLRQFSKQFYRGYKLNKNVELGYTVSIGEITSEYALINIVRE